jgi:hypothetical protein
MSKLERLLFDLKPGDSIKVTWELPEAHCRLTKTVQIAPKEIAK